MRIMVFCVGGTIDKVYFDQMSDYQVGSPFVQSFLKDRPLHFDWQVETLMRKDSLDMDDADRSHLRERIAACACDRILVTHGTDTMAASAAALQSIGGKVIVLSGSMTPGRFQETDAAFNLAFALGSLQQLGPGVYICMNGRTFVAAGARKDRDAMCFGGTMIPPD